MIIIGLGNPGKRYADTRHSVGYMFIDFLSKSFEAHPSSEILLHKTDCFMNISGSYVQKVLKQKKDMPLDQLYIAHDDLDIPLGKFKITYAKGPKVHNGISSVERALGTSDFWRIRIGIDNRTNEPTSLPGEGYVLSPFSEKERSLLVDVFGTIAKTIGEL